MDVNDDPPIYEPPPSYEEVMKKEKERIAKSCNNFLRLNTINCYNKLIYYFIIS